MTRSEIEEKVLTLIKAEKKVPDVAITADTILADAGIDSLDSLTILFAIEEEFGISIPDPEARAMKTFGDMVASIERLVPAG